MSAALAAALSVSVFATASRSPWKQIAPGVENATVADLGGDANWAAKVVLADPALVQFAVRFDPKKPTLKEWRERFPSAIAIINGSFYSSDSAEIRPTCELVQEGKRVRGAGCQRQDALFFGARAKGVPPVVASIAPTRPPASMPAPRVLAPNAYKADDWTEALAVLDHGQDLDRRDRDGLQPGEPAKRGAREAAECIVGEPGSPAGERGCRRRSPLGQVPEGAAAGDPGLCVRVSAA